MLPHDKSNTVKGVFVNPFKRNSHDRVEVQRALNNISFDVKKGEFFGIVGRNGSGKSTLLKIIAGIYQPSKGSVGVNGRLVPFIELGVGFDPELSGRENVYLNGALLGFSTKEVDAKYKAIVDFAEIERFMDQKLKNYSSGMQVRLAFSVATILAQSDILLIDEVLAVGDADFQRKCFNYFKKLKRDKKTVIFVTHDMSAIEQYCDRVLLINDSVAVNIGSANDVSRQYSQLFIKDNETTVKNNKKNPSGEQRWGDGMIRWQKVSAKFISSKDDKKSSQVKITAQGTANANVDHPIFGFSVKNDQFVQLLGTNTLRLKQEVGPLQKGDSFEVSWSVPNVFSNGDYYVDCTAAQDTATMVCDRWPDATQFTVNSSEDSPYLVHTNVAYNDNIEV